LRYDVAIDLSVGIQQPQSALGIAAVGGTAGLFVDTGGDHYQRGVRQILVVSIDNACLGTKR
jgi:hypothetical protein